MNQIKRDREYARQLIDEHSLLDHHLRLTPNLLLMVRSRASRHLDPSPPNSSAVTRVGREKDHDDGVFGWVVGDDGFLDALVERFFGVVVAQPVEFRDGRKEGRRVDYQGSAFVTIEIKV